MGGFTLKMSRIFLRLALRTIGLSPWTWPDCGYLGVVPRFPLYSGSQRFERDEWVRDAQGTVPMNGAEARLRSAKARSQSARGIDVLPGKGATSLMIEADGFVCIWKPGQMWWSQAWQLPARAPGYAGRVEGKQVSMYRAALSATSRDGKLDNRLPEAARGGRILQE